MRSKRSNNKNIQGRDRMRNLGNLYSSRDYASHDHVVGGSWWRSFAKSFGGNLAGLFHLSDNAFSLSFPSRTSSKQIFRERNRERRGVYTGGMLVYKREDQGVSFSRIRRQPLLNILFNFITSHFRCIYVICIK